MNVQPFFGAGKKPVFHTKRLSAMITKLAAVFVMLAFSCSCGEVPMYSREFIAMDTLVSVKAYGKDCEAAVNAAVDRVNELEKLFSVTDPESDIYSVNRKGSAAVSEDTARIVSDALEICEKTEGALDITIYPVLREWGFTTSERKVPSDSGISSALAKTGYKNVSVSGCNITVPAGFELDLGSCAKGRAAGEIAGIMTESGVTSAIADLGGNVQTVGYSPDGSDWKIGIADPFSPNEIFSVIRVHDKAVVTSGGYQRFFKDFDGKTYIHIIDPSTGRPADSGLASVTVVGDDGFLCDALSTALFVMGKERACAYWRVHGGFDMILIDSEGNCAVTAGISDSVSLSSGAVPEVIR